MSMNDEQSFKRLLAETKERAREVVGQTHVSSDARTVINDFMTLADRFEYVVLHQKDSSGDARLLQKKYDSLKSENREIEKKLEKMRETLTSELAPILKEFSAQAAFLDAEAHKQVNTLLKQASRKIKRGIADLIEVLKKL